MANSDWAVSTTIVDNFTNRQPLTPPISTTAGGTVYMVVTFTRVNQQPSLPHDLKVRTTFLRDPDEADEAVAGAGPLTLSITTDPYIYDHAQGIPSTFPQGSHWDILVRIKDGDDPWVIKNEIEISLPG